MLDEVAIVSREPETAVEVPMINTPDEEEIVSDDANAAVPVTFRVPPIKTFPENVPDGAEKSPVELVKVNPEELRNPVAVS